MLLQLRTTRNRLEDYDTILSLGLASSSKSCDTDAAFDASV
jgi:hypothetical protein